MKTTIIALLLVAGTLVVAIPAFAWSGKVSSSEESSVLSNKAGQKYTCPMHPEIIADKPGQCPKCGMKLVPLKGPAK